MSISHFKVCLELVWILVLVLTSTKIKSAQKKQVVLKPKIGKKITDEKLHC